MFGFLKKNSNNKNKELATVSRTALDWVMANCSTEFGLSHPNWESIYQRVDADYADAESHELWEGIAFSWLSSLQKQLGQNYAITESENFMLLSVNDTRFGRSLLSYLESCLRRILRLLDSVASDEGYGKHVVVVFENHDRYYDYISHYGPQEGTFGMSAGVHLSVGYSHFAFPMHDLDFTESVVAHEMSHALVSHLPLPLWLNEGLAVSVESALTGRSGAPMALDSFDRHTDFWNAKTIQEFWSGESFSRADEGQELSYQLATVLVENLSEDKSRFVAYCNEASWQDAGERALNRVYDLSLQDLLSNLFGEGEWKPISLEVSENRNL